jgi:hypothetical protein
MPAARCGMAQTNEVPGSYLRAVDELVAPFHIDPGFAHADC